MAATLSRLSPLKARLSTLASDLSSRSFICRRCLHQQLPKTTAPLRDTPFLRAFRQPHLRKQNSTASSRSSSQSSPLTELAQSFASQTAHHSQSSWPKTSSKSAAYWLFGSAASVFGIVVFGGLTRLTESGLSITEWRPVTGSFPPRNEQVWEEEFARYKLSPEFKMLNSRMNLEEFKQIYWMEWTHRLWGRIVGITFLVPTIYFIARRRVDPRMATRLVGICALIGFQGFIGWWMVKSGLKDDLLETGTHPRVSQYRLAAHLGTAFVAYLAMLSGGLAIYRENRLLEHPARALKHLEFLQRPQLRNFRRLVRGLCVLVFVTAMSGALVAGLDAGLVYNDFPWMGQGLLPPKREMLDPFYSHTDDQGDLIWRNMLENPVLAQLDHRILATTTFSAVLALWAYTRFTPALRKTSPIIFGKTRLVGLLVPLVSLQAALGITTLWYLVPTPLASAHQAGALILLSAVFLLSGVISVPPRTLRLVQQAASQLETQNTVASRAWLHTKRTPRNAGRRERITL